MSSLLERLRAEVDEDVNEPLDRLQEEAAKHPVPEGKYVKVQCVHKSVPRIIE